MPSPIGRSIAATRSTGDVGAGLGDKDSGHPVAAAPEELGPPARAEPDVEHLGAQAEPELLDDVSPMCAGGWPARRSEARRTASSRTSTAALGQLLDVRLVSGRVILAEARQPPRGSLQRRGVMRLPRHRGHRILRRTLARWPSTRNLPLPELFLNLFRREVSVKYRGSALGLAWTLINPIMLMLGYWLIFSDRPRGDGRPLPALPALRARRLGLLPVGDPDVVHEPARPGDPREAGALSRQLLPVSVVATNARHAARHARSRHPGEPDLPSRDADRRSGPGFRSCCRSLRSRAGSRSSSPRRRSSSATSSIC